MSCEMCGKFAGPDLAEYEVDGVLMLLCPKCSKFGTKVSHKPVPSHEEEEEAAVAFVRQRPDGEGTSVSYVKTSSRPSAPPRASSSRPSQRKAKDLLLGDEVLIDDYGEVIKEARKRRGLSLEDFAQMINEKVSLLQKIEKSEFRPPDSLVIKIERALQISLREEAASPIFTSLSSTKDTTLGDVVKLKKKKRRT